MTKPLEEMKQVSYDHDKTWAYLYGKKKVDPKFERAWMLADGLQMELAFILGVAQRPKPKLRQKFSRWVASKLDPRFW